MGWFRFVGRIYYGWCRYPAGGVAGNTETFKNSKQYSPAQINQAEYMAYPQIPTIFVWRVTRHDGQYWTAGKVNVLFGLDLDELSWNKIGTVENEWTKRANQLEDIKIFNWFTMGRMRASYIYRRGQHIVEFHDMRYGIRPEAVESLWSMQVSFADNGELIDIRHTRHFHKGGFKELAGRVWGDLWSP